jgi:hypothetical protein
MGFAPRDTARFKIALPSVPLSPTAPPIPATGLTINPMVFTETSFSAFAHNAYSFSNYALE